MALEHFTVTLKTVPLLLLHDSGPYCLTNCGLDNPCLKPSADCNNETHLSDVCFLIHPWTYLKSSLYQNILCPLKLLMANIPWNFHSCPLFRYHMVKKFCKTHSAILKGCSGSSASCSVFNKQSMVVWVIYLSTVCQYCWLFFHCFDWLHQ